MVSKLIKFWWNRLEETKITFFFYQFIWILVFLVEPVLIPTSIDHIRDLAEFIFRGGAIPYYWIGILMFALGFFGIAFPFIGILSSKLIPTFENNIRRYIFNFVQQLPLDYFAKQEEGNILHRIETLVEFSSTILDLVQRKLLTVIAISFYNIFKFMSCSFLMGSIIAIWILLHAWLCWYTYTKLRDLTHINAEWNNKIYGFIVDSFKNQSNVEIFNLKLRQIQKLDDLQQQLGGVHAKLLYSSYNLKALQCLVCFLIQGVVIISLLVYYLKTNRINPTEFKHLLTLQIVVTKTAWNLTERLPELFYYIGKAMAAYSIIEEVVQPQGKKIPESKGIIEIKALEIEQISISTTPINISIKYGDRVAIVGASGVGKSTLMRALLGLIKTYKGSIELDEGVEVRQVSREFLSTYINYIPCQRILFNCSVRDNLLSTSAAMIRKGAKTAELEDTIKELPKGLETIVGNDGALLSDGQKQRISIARAVAKNENAKILLMDEPFGALDGNMSKRILTNLLEVYREKTILCIDHSLTFLPYADYVLFIQPGKSAIYAPKAEIMLVKDFYDFIKTTTSTDDKDNDNYLTTTN